MLENDYGMSYHIEEIKKRDEIESKNKNVLMTSLEIFYAFEWELYIFSPQVSSTVADNQNEIVDIFWDIINKSNYNYRRNNNMPWEEWFWI